MEGGRRKLLGIQLRLKFVLTVTYFALDNLCPPEISLKFRERLCLLGQKYLSLFIRPKKKKKGDGLYLPEFFEGRISDLLSCILLIFFRAKHI